VIKYWELYRTFKNKKKGGEGKEGEWRGGFVHNKYIKDVQEAHALEPHMTVHMMWVAYCNIMFG